MIRYRCMSCRTSLASEMDQAGTFDPCPVCGNRNVVPNPSVNAKHPFAWTVMVLCGVFCLSSIIIAAICLGIGMSQGSAPASPLDAPPSQGPAPAPTAATLRNPVVEVSWVEATDDFIARIEPELTDVDRQRLGLAVLLSNSDLYAVKVTLINRGNIPLRLFPENIRMHYGTDSAIVSTIDRAGFLQQVVLQPGEYTQGLVAFVAQVDIGAAIRLRGGGLSYNDSTINVRYRQ